MSILIVLPGGFDALSPDAPARGYGEPVSRSDRNEPAATAPDRPRLVSEAARSWTALGIGMVLLFLGCFLVALIAVGSGTLEPSAFRGLPAYVVIYLAYWILYCLLYLWLTYRLFRRRPGSTLQVWLAESERARRRRRLVDALSSSSGPSAAVSFAGVALLAVVFVAVRAELRTDPLILGLSVGTVACSWLLMTVAYALHYAREYVHAGGLDFPEDPAERDPGPTMGDFFYLSVQVSTTFSTSDVTVLSRAMRQTVSGQSLVAFTFNSVIVALLVSLLLASV